MQYDYSRPALYKPQTKPVFIEPWPIMAPDVDINNFSADLAWWLSNIAHLAYYPVKRIEPALAKTGLEVLSFLDNKGTQALLLKADHFAVLSFRGTQFNSIRDLLTDANIRLTDFHDNGEVHKGFLDALDVIWPQLEPELQQLSQQNIPIWYTGHSLGGALAALASVRHKPTGVMSFGSPLVGDSEFVKSVAAMPIYRVVNCADVVTGLPFEQLGYRHVGRLHFFTQDAALHIDPSEAIIDQQQTKAQWDYFWQCRWLGWNRVLLRSFADHAIVNYTATIAQYIHS